MKLLIINSEYNENPPHFHADVIIRVTPYQFGYKLKCIKNRYGDEEFLWMGEVIDLGKLKLLMLSEASMDNRMDGVPFEDVSLKNLKPEYYSSVTHADLVIYMKISNNGTPFVLLKNRFGNGELNQFKFNEIIQL